MLALLLAVGLALIGFGFTVLFGAPVGPLQSFPYWAETGTSMVILGAAVALVACIAMARRHGDRRREKQAKDTVERGHLNAEIARLKADVAVREHWLDNAREYGDALREKQRLGELGQLRAKISEINGRLDELPEVPAARGWSPTFIGKNTWRLRNRTGGPATIVGLLGEGPLDITLRRSLPVSLKSGEEFDVLLHRILSPGQERVLLIDWEGPNGAITRDRYTV